MTSLADPDVDLLIQTAIIADGAVEVLEVSSRLQLGTLNGDGRERGGGSRHWLEQYLYLAEADGEAKKVGG